LHYVILARYTEYHGTWFDMLSYIFCMFYLLFVHSICETWLLINTEVYSEKLRSIHFSLLQIVTDILKSLLRYVVDWDAELVRDIKSRLKSLHPIWHINKTETIFSCLFDNIIILILLAWQEWQGNEWLNERVTNEQFTFLSFCSIIQECNRCPILRVY